MCLKIPHATHKFRNFFFCVQYPLGGQQKQQQKKEHKKEWMNGRMNIHASVKFI